MKKIIFLLFVYFLQFNLVTANTKIAFIDMDKVLSTSKPGSSVLKQLNTINNINFDGFKSDEKNLKEKEIKLIAQKNILSEVDFKSSLDKLKLEIKKYNEKRNKINNDFNKLKTDNTNKLLKMINLILIKYSNEKSLSLILQKKNLIIGKIELDITEDVIKIVNSDIDEFNIK
tara:strand:+ start:935 stop:1453 length:519 start_codon:yes stop_codon:yes gene_type:complete